MQPSASQPEPGSGWRAAGRPAVFVVAAAALVIFYANFNHELSLHALAKHEAELRQYNSEHPVLLPLIVAAIYVLATGISLPIGIILAIGCGWLFGLWEAGVLVSFAATAGATLAFWISRYLLRDAIAHRFDHLMKSVDELLERDGAVYLLSLRLVHVIPSWLINLLMGWTNIRTWTFWWATQLGTLPAIVFYVYVGEQLKSLHELSHRGLSSLLTPWHVVIFFALAIVPLAAQALFHWFQSRRRKL